MNALFGPVNSRRLGRSLGIDLFTSKICNLHCVYCEVGPTITPVCRRGAYSPVRALLEEIDGFCADSVRLASIDVLTVTAQGEPTLHSGLGTILAHLRAKADKPVAVLTNGTTLMDEGVRGDLMAADIVIPSLDAARTESFRRVDRPAAELDLEAIIEGLTVFSHAFAGALWLEILLVHGMNDTSEDIDALIGVLGRMRLDRIQLNTVVRPPVEQDARPVSNERLTAIAQRLRQALSRPVDLPFATLNGEGGTRPALSAGPEAAAIIEQIRDMVWRRPCTAADMARIFRLEGPEQIEQLLAPLVRAGELRLLEHGGHRFYQRGP